MSDALRLAVADVDMQRRAADLGARIRGEDGVAAAVRHFDALAPRGA